MARSSIIFCLCLGGFVLYQYINKADRDETGIIVSEGAVDAFSLKIGDCFNDEGDMQTDGEITELPGLPCTAPHDNEIYALFDIVMDEYPGEEVISELALDGCMQRFEPFVGIPYDSSVLDVYYLSPTIESWSQQNDREIVCAIYHMDNEKLVDSMRGAGI